ncbi:MAG: sugar phosphate isomerase/epimerase [Chthoniobacteraceae bacterium]
MKYLLSLTALLLAAAPLRAAGYPDELKTNGFVLGCQAYTFNRFTVFEAIEKTAYAGGKVIEFYPGQRLSPAEPTLTFGHEPGRVKAGAEAKPRPATEPLGADEAKAVWDKVLAKCKQHGITPVAYGVVGIPTDEAPARKIFEFAKTMGIRVINTESDKSIDMIEKLVKEFDIKVGFHDHPKRPNDESYRMWDPNYIVELTKGRDARIGSCADIGHWVRSGLKPVDCVKILKGRIVSAHIKDLDKPLPSGKDVHWGQGVSGVPAVLDEFRAQGFEGPLSVEYETNWETNAEDAKACIAFVAGYKKK